jgi:hypothetical protein
VTPPLGTKVPGLAPSGGDWSEGMAATADVGEMTRMWAGEQYLGHWDGYSIRESRYQPNNYYLHSDEAGRFSMLPSGIGQTFHEADAFPGTGRGILITRCLGDASCLADCRSHLGAVAAAADAMPVGERLDAIAATVAPWRDCPHLEQATDAAWQQAVKGTREFIRNRRIAVASYLAARFRVPRRGALTVHARFLGTSRLAPRSAAPRRLRPRARARSASRGGS